MRILPSNELNAFACGGHLVVVTSFAVERLTRPELAGVLAHELSHHLGMHTVALTLGHWLSLPIVLFARFGFFLQNVARAATDNFAAHSSALTALGRLVGALLTAISWVFLAALYASDALANLVGHSSEFEADRRAIRMGYGRQLAEALRRVISLGGGTRTIGWRARLGATHPPARTRVARIEAIMRHPSGIAESSRLTLRSEMNVGRRLVRRTSVHRGRHMTAMCATTASVSAIRSAVRTSTSTPRLPPLT